MLTSVEHDSHRMYWSISVSVWLFELVPSLFICRRKTKASPSNSGLLPDRRKQGSIWRWIRERGRWRRVTSQHEVKSSSYVVLLRCLALTISVTGLMESVWRDVHPTMWNYGLLQLISTRKLTDCTLCLSSTEGQLHDVCHALSHK